MSKKITRKNVAPTAEEIKNKKKLLEEGFKQLKTEVSLSPTQLFLGQIKDLLEVAIKDKISYRKIAIKIEEVYGYRVSEQSLRTFVKKIGVAPLKVEEKKQIEKATTPIFPPKEKPIENKGWGFGGRK